jgi:hypothetical protein
MNSKLRVFLKKDYTLILFGLLVGFFLSFLMNELYLANNIFLKATKVGNFKMKENPSKCFIRRVIISSEKIQFFLRYSLTMR